MDVRAYETLLTEFKSLEGQSLRYTASVICTEQWHHHTVVNGSELLSEELQGRTQGRSGG